MTFATLLPYLLAGVGGFLLRHFNVLGAASLLSGPQLLASPQAPAPLRSVSANHPILSDAVRAAVQQAAADAAAGHIASLKSELAAVVEAAVTKVVADLKPKN